jgi:hypothetical protein
VRVSLAAPISIAQPGAELGAGRGGRGTQTMEITSNSNNSALQALQALLSSVQADSANSASAFAPAGQNLPTTGATAAATSPAPSSGASQFAATTLAVLTALQAAETANTSGSPNPTADGSSNSLETGFSDLFSAVRHLKDGLSGPAQTQSLTTSSLLSMTLSLTASAFNLATSSPLVQGFDAVEAALDAWKAPGGTTTTTA